MNGHDPHGPLLNQATDWVWFQAKDGEEGPNPGEQYLAAERAIDNMLRMFKENKIPFEQVYCPVSFTKNIVIPDGIQNTLGIAAMFKDAGYKERHIPEATDKQQSLALREAIMQGAQLDKKWH